MIAIRQKSIPYSHEYATRCLIPNTGFFLEAWPTKFIIFNDQKRSEFDLLCTGPIKDFTVKLDLENGLVLCSFKAQEGYFCWSIKACLRGIEFYLKRACDSGILVNKRLLLRSDRFVFDAGVEQNIHTSFERLCLGSHKQQNIQKILTRADPKELLPLYFRLGQYFEPSEPLEGFDVMKRVELCQMSSLFYLSDSKHALLGVDHTPLEIDFFAKSFRFIRDIFFKQEGNTLLFLPGPIDFNSGRLTSLKFSHGTLSFIFRKKRVLRIIIDPTEDGKIHLNLVQKFSSFRVLKCLRKKGQILSSKDPIELKKSTRLYLDKFYF